MVEEMIDEYTVVDPLIVFYDYFWILTAIIFFMILFGALWIKKYGKTHRVCIICHQVKPFAIEYQDDGICRECLNDITPIIAKQVEGLRDKGK